MHNRLARRSLFVVAASLSVVAVGCGATGGAKSSQEVSAGLARASSATAVTEAAQTTAGVSSEKVSITVATEGGNVPAVSVTSTGEVDAANKTAHLTADLAGGKGGLTTIETVYDGDTVYLKAPFTSMLGTKPWIKITSPKLAEAVDQLGGSVQPDPDALLSFLEGAGSVKTVGDEEVRGEPTRHLSVQVEPAKVIDQVPAERRQKLEQQLDRLGVTLAELPTVPADVWIDSDGYVRKLSVSFDLAELAKVHPKATSKTGKGISGTVTATVELYDFNQPVHVQVPKASEVSELDLSKLGAGFRQGD